MVQQGSTLHWNYRIEAEALRVRTSNLYEILGLYEDWCKPTRALSEHENANQRVHVSSTCICPQRISKNRRH